MQGSNISSPPTVLVVEDEPIILMLVADLLEEAGFRPVMALNADEALEIMSSRGDIRIMITDVDMPGSMDGLRLARAVRDRWPPMELIVVSGHCDVLAGDLPERGRFFAKPYSHDALLSAVREMTAWSASATARQSLETAWRFQ